MHVKSHFADRTMRLFKVPASPFALRRWLLALLCLLALAAQAQTDPLPSWNEGAAKARILAFVAAVTEPGGKEYVAIVTGDHYRMGKNAADLLAQAIGETGTYGFIQLDVPFYNSNNREKGFLAEMAQAHPGLKNVAWAGFTADTTVGPDTDAMLLQNPDLNGIYVSYSGGPATAVLASLASASNTTTKVVTHDLDAANDVIMATAGSNYAGTAIEHTFDEGANTVKMAALSRCGVEVPPFVVVPAMAVNRDNLAQAWQEAFHADPPAEVTAALAK